MKPALPSPTIPLAPFAPPRKPAHPAVLLTGKALVGAPTHEQARNVEQWRAWWLGLQR